MTDFLLVMAKINLAMIAAILMVALFRRPMRAAFGPPIAYALWLLVPASALASLLPPRIVAVAAPIPIVAQIPVAARHAVQSFAPPVSSFDGSIFLFAAWTLGVAAMLAWMAWAQFQFRRAERRGVAGPAVAGFLKPRIVIPAGFAAQFSVPEQAAILAHEHAHLARQDARINAAMALLRCLCWFNPLVHMGAVLLRRDQELACDAAALSQVSRVDYANALFKSQMRPMALPLGCAWPGSEHPLTERVALLKSPLPGRARRWTGMGTVLALTLFAGFGAWAAQPVQTAPAAAVAAAQANTQANGAHFAIRVVDESVANYASQSTASDDQVPQAGGRGVLWLKRGGQIGGDALAEAHASTGQDGKPIIEFSLTQKGAEKFAEMTRENIGHRLAVVVNGTVITAPIVNGPI